MSIPELVKAIERVAILSGHVDFNEVVDCLTGHCFDEEDAGTIKRLYDQALHQSHEDDLNI